VADLGLLQKELDEFGSSIQLYWIELGSNVDCEVALNMKNDSEKP